MVDEKKEKTALATSVGADERQSIQPYNDAIIATGNTEINHPDENFDEIYRQFLLFASQASRSRMICTLAEFMKPNRFSSTIAKATKVTMAEMIYSKNLFCRERLSERKC